MNWSAAVAELSPGLLSYFLAVFPRPVAAELVQEVLLRLVQHVRAGRFSAEKGSLRMYAYGIARLVRLESRRREGPAATALTSEAWAALPAAPAADGDDAARLRRAIARLKPVEQDVILLLLDRDLALAEIADTLAMPLGTVKSHMHRAKASIKAHLNAAAAAEEH